MPEVELGQYKGVEVPKEADEVTTEEVDAQMDRLRNEFAELKPVEGRAVQNGDFVTADFRAEVEGEAVEGLEATDFVFEVGAGRIFDEVEEAVVGMNAGETKTFPLALPEGFPDDLAGKTADFTVTVKEIKEKVLPALTDEWASEISEFPTVARAPRGDPRQDAGRQDLLRRSELPLPGREGRRRQRQARHARRRRSREQAEELLADFTRSLQAQGADLNAYMAATGVTAEQMLEDMKPTAASNVKTGLVLDAVAKAEGLEATDEEVQAAVAQMAMASRIDAKRVREAAAQERQAADRQVADPARQGGRFHRRQRRAADRGRRCRGRGQEALAKAEAAKTADAPAKPKTTAPKAAKAAPAEAEPAAEAAAAQTPKPRKRRLPPRNEHQSTRKGRLP